MREIRTQKIGSHIMNSHVKRPRIATNYGIGSLKSFQSHIHEITNKKTSYNEVRMDFFDARILAEKLLIKC